MEVSLQVLVANECTWAATNDLNTQPVVVQWSIGLDWKLFWTDEPHTLR